MAQAAHFWDRIAPRYAKSPVSNPDAYERKLAMTRALLRPDMAVLEVGCGTGTTALRHAPHVARIRAVDISPRMIAIARDKARAAGVDNVTFETAAIADLDLAPESVDAAMAHSILHLVDDRAGALAALHRALKPGGLFVSSTACLGGSMAWLRFVLPIGRVLGPLPLVRFFTADALMAEIRAAGFVIDHHWQPGPRQALFVIARKD